MSDDGQTLCRPEASCCGTSPGERWGEEDTHRFDGMCCVDMAGGGPLHAPCTATGDEDGRWSPAVDAEWTGADLGDGQPVRYAPQPECADDGRLHDGRFSDD